MREKLKNLLKNAKYPLSEGYPAEAHLASQLSGKGLDYIADFLLENGVIVPPVKEGDELYRVIVPKNGEPYVSSCTAKVEPYAIYYQCAADAYYRILPDDIGKSVFLTREEAEKALKGGAE